MVADSAGGREELEALVGECHELWGTGQIPVCVGHFGVADIRRERGHGIAYIGTVIMPKLDATADEGVAVIPISELSP
jgi:hypothetical protein